MPSLQEMVSKIESYLAASVKWPVYCVVVIQFHDSSLCLRSITLKRLRFRNHMGTATGSYIYTLEILSYKWLQKPCTCACIQKKKLYSSCTKAISMTYYPYVHMCVNSLLSYFVSLPVVLVVFCFDLTGKVCTNYINV